MIIIGIISPSDSRKNVLIYAIKHFCLHTSIRNFLYTKHVFGIENILQAWLRIANSELLKIWSIVKCYI